MSAFAGSLFETAILSFPVATPLLKGQPFCNTWQQLFPCSTAFQRKAALKPIRAQASQSKEERPSQAEETAAEVVEAEKVVSLEQPGRSFLPSSKATQVPGTVEAQKSASARNALERAVAYKKMRSSQGIEESQGEFSQRNGMVDLSSPSVNTPEDVNFEGNSFQTKAISPYRSSSSSSEASDSSSSSDTSTVVFDSGLESNAAWSRVDRNAAEPLDASPKPSGKQLFGGASGGSIPPRDIEVEIVTRNGVIKRKVSKPEEVFANIKDFKRSGVSSTDFMGLDFSDKKRSGTPAGLRIAVEAPPSGTLPEIEIITKDGEMAKRENLDGVKEDLYKPKVTTWGVFPRPADISRTYGGGKTIRPGDQLETEEEKQAREARTKKLLDDYRKKIGLDVDPNIRADCERALKQGDTLLNKGKLQDALVYFEKVMQNMPYQSELHGVAALQWSVCLDSLNRLEEARSMYEKIASHPSVMVRRKAKQCLFGFQAMEKLKFSGSYEWDATTYRRYFDAFSDGYNTTYKEQNKDIAGDQIFGQTFPYVIFLAFPFLLVLVLVLMKGR